MKSYRCIFRGGGALSALISGRSFIAATAAAAAFLMPPSSAALDFPAAAPQVLTSPPVNTEKMPITGFTSLDFEVLEATGISNIDEMSMTPCKTQTVNGELFVDLQTGEDKDWIKCLRIVFSEESGTVYVRQDHAYYYPKSFGVGAYTYDDFDGTIVKEGSYYSGGDGQYGIKALYLANAAKGARTYSEVFPKGDVTIGRGVYLTLSGDAASGTIANNIAITQASLSVEASASVTYSGAISGSRGAISLATSPAVSSEESSGSSVVTENSANDMPENYTDYVLLFEGAKLADFTASSINSAELKQNSETMTAHAYYFARSEDGMSVTYELQYQNTSDQWVKCCKIELVERGVGVYGRRVQGFYYTGQTNNPKYEGTKTWESHESDKDIRTSDYGVGKINATFTRYPVRIFTLVNSMCSSYASDGEAVYGMQGFSCDGNPLNSGRHMHALVAQGYDLADLRSVQVSSTLFMTDDSSRSVRETTLCVPDALSPVYQYQVETSDHLIKCVFFRLVQTAENDILGYSIRCCAFDATREDVAFGEDLTGTVADHENQHYNITGLALDFARTAVPVAVSLTGVNSCENCAITVTAGSRASILAYEALPKGGSIEVQEGARLTLGHGTTQGGVSGNCSLTIRRGAVVVTRGQTALKGDRAKVLVEGGLMYFMGNEEYVCDAGDYIPSIELKDGGTITGYSPRGSDSTKLLVTGTGCSTNDAGVMLGMQSGTAVYPVIVNDTTGDAGVDLEFSGAISAHGGAKNGGIAKQGAGTMRLTSHYLMADPWMRLDEGGLVLGRSGMWAGERLVVNGGTLSVEDGVTGNRAASLDLQGSANLALGAGATLDIGDCTSVEWAEGAKLTVSFSQGSLLYGDVTDAQLAKLRTDDGSKLMRGADRLLKIAPDKGFIVIFR